MNIEQFLDDARFALAKSAFHGTRHDPERRGHAHRNDRIIELARTFVRPGG
jgi:hypothetical protein